MDKNKRVVPTEWPSDIKVMSTGPSMKVGSEEHTIWKLKYGTPENWWNEMITRINNTPIEELDLENSKSGYY